MLRGSKLAGHCMARMVATISLGAVLALSACAPMDRYVGSAFESVATLGGSLGAPWGNVRPLSPADGVTVARVRAGGGMGGTEVLTTEPGNVWPAAEGPRATLANPDEALRGIPSYRPGADAYPTQPPASERPRRRPRGSDAAYVPPEPAYPPPLTAVTPPVASPRAPLSGSTVYTPGGGARVITGTSGNTSTTISPSGQSGVLLRDGNVQILQEPGRPAQQTIVPR